MSIARQIEIEDEHELYPIHEEDNLPERPIHERAVRNLLTALDLWFPQYWVGGDICMYWIEDAFNLYRVPDILVLGCPREEHPFDVYLSWRDAPALLAVEVGSKSTFKEDEGPKVEQYLMDLDVQEYLYFRPHQRPKRPELRMWRLEEEEPVQVKPEANGRLKSLRLGLEFSVADDGELLAYDAAGLRLPVARDLQLQVEDERKRADWAQAIAEREQGRLLEERLRADRERDRAERAEASAAAERGRVLALEQELARFQEEQRRRDAGG